jgi:hypothetical protein
MGLSSRLAGLVAHLATPLAESIQAGARNHDQRRVVHADSASAPKLPVPRRSNLRIFD